MWNPSHLIEQEKSATQYTRFSEMAAVPLNSCVKSKSLDWSRVECYDMLSEMAAVLLNSYVKPMSLGWTGVEWY